MQEAYGYTESGKFYKEPEVPIWVVYSESHYSVLFNPRLSNIGNAQSSFDLFYWDMLAKQHQTIKLTIRFDKEEHLDPTDEGSLIPPLDLVIRTRWPGASVDWNDTEPIL